MNAPKLTRRQAIWIPAFLIGLLAALLVVHAQTQGASMTIKCVQRWRTPQTLRAEVLRRESDECYYEGVRTSEPTLTFVVLGLLGGLAGALGFHVGRRSAVDRTAAPPN